NTKDKVAYLCLIKEATFEKSVVAGDQLVITSRITQSFTPFYVFEAVATVDSEIASKAVITLSLTIKGTT
ncbi:MAG: 3-hydroxyacyl-[acyl-carrier-protein] dehydratase FabZ, partial [Candidatus Kuenenia stuttgartiensis]|nr:3-hydroxyacyl-[acyl-carrier-protein] dehydratase FabZ [Candidatus Kuenenia stuttgartiensis]